LVGGKWVSPSPSPSMKWVGAYFVCVMFMCLNWCFSCVCCALCVSCVWCVGV
jgi:hypothetical protein